MRIKVAVAVAAFSVAFAGIAVGQDSPIPARQELMKENGADGKQMIADAEALEAKYYK